MSDGAAAPMRSRGQPCFQARPDPPRLLAPLPGLPTRLSRSPVCPARCRTQPARTTATMRCLPAIARPRAQTAFERAARHRPILRGLARRSRERQGSGQSKWRVRAARRRVLRYVPGTNDTTVACQERRRRQDANRTSDLHAGNGERLHLGMGRRSERHAGHRNATSRIARASKHFVTPNGPLVSSCHRSEPERAPDRWTVYDTVTLYLEPAELRWFTMAHERVDVRGCRSRRWQSSSVPTAWPRPSTARRSPRRTASR